MFKTFKEVDIQFIRCWANDKISTFIDDDDQIVYLLNWTDGDLEFTDVKKMEEFILSSLNIKLSTKREMGVSKLI